MRPQTGEDGVQTPMIVIGVDIGKTGARAAWSRPGAQSRAGREIEAPGAPGLAAAGGAAQTAAAVERVLVPALEATTGEGPVSLCVGAAGALAAPGPAVDLADRLLATHPRLTTVAVTSDAVLAHAAAFHGADGVVLAVGTGSVALGIGRDGRAHRADGWGTLLGDEGSGSWIGRQGLAAALAAEDGRGPATALLAAAHDRWGDPATWSAQVDASDNPGRWTAAFAPQVADAATAGDDVAADIMRRAAEALAQTAAAAARRSQSHEVAALGGLLHLGRVLVDPLSRALAEEGLHLRVAQVRNTDGALLLASGTPTNMEPLLHRRRRSGAS